jgi:hypothetical protein
VLSDHDNNLARSPRSDWITIETGHMRREVVPTHDSVSALSAHVSIRFFSIANIELGSSETRMHIALSATAIGIAAFCSISCGADQKSNAPRDPSSVRADAVTVVEQRASQTFGLTIPVRLVEFNVDRALQDGRCVDADGASLEFCWDGRWSIEPRELEGGFYEGPCPPTPGGLSPDREHAIVVLASISVLRSLPSSELKEMAEYQQTNGHGAPFSELGPRAWASRLLWIARAPRYSVVGEILDCEP